MRTKKFFYNSITTALLQLCTLIAGIIIPRLMILTYGSEINGLVSSISQFISYFTLVEAGLSSAAVYALYKPLAEKNYDEINGIVSAANRFYIISGCIFLSLVIGFAAIYPLFVRLEQLSPFMVGILVLILGTSGALDFFTLSKYRVLLTADQKTYVLSLASILGIFINTTIIIILANLKVSIVLLRFFALFSVFSRTIILYLYVKINYRFINYKAKPINQALDKRWDALYLQILGVIHQGTPVIIATLFLSLHYVSIYSVFNMVIAGIGGLLGIFVSGLSASFGDVIAKKEEKVLQKAYKQFEFTYYMIITFFYSCTFTLIMPFIRLYTTGVDINYNLPVIGFLITLNGLFYNLKTPQGMLVISAGMYKETRWRTTTQGLIAVIGGVIGAQIWGLAGILLGSIASNIYRDIDLLFFVPKHITKLNYRYSLIRMIRVLLTVALILFVTSFIKYQVDNYMQWIIFGFCVSAISIAITLLVNYIFDRQLFIDSFKRVISVFKRG